MLLIIDNYDSFTYNLVQYFQELGQEVIVKRNDAITIPEIEKLNPQFLVISPGPCTPTEAGISLDVIRNFSGKIPILGVCLGHQTIAQALGGRVVRAKRLMHGKTSTIYHDGKTIYKCLPNSFTATRYHSLIVKEDSLPACLEITARSENGELMGLRHRFLPIEGVQFHPESILTTVGKKLLNNFLETYRGYC
ncbi:MAG: anthranilate synthase component [Clostridia bacterium]|nr:anthranilate synthase component [Clostridia bacterium]